MNKFNKLKNQLFRINKQKKKKKNNNKKKDLPVWSFKSRIRVLNSSVSIVKNASYWIEGIFCVSRGSLSNVRTFDANESLLSPKTSNYILLILK